MTPSRRTPRTPAPASTRRPRVAGLRKPAAGKDSRPSPRPRPEPAEEPTGPADPTAERATEDTTPVEAAADARSTAELNTTAEPDTTAELDTTAEPDTTARPDDTAEPETVAEPEWPTARTAPVEAEPDTEPEAGAEVGKDTATGAEPEARPRPSPRRKTRDAGVTKPTSEAEAARAAGAAAGRQRAAGGSRRTVTARSPKVLIGVFLAAAVVFAALAVFFRIQGSEAEAATANKALIDVARTAQVKQQTSEAVEALFSYDYNDIAKTENAAKDLLVTDEVRTKYEQQFAEVKRLAPEQKMVVTTKVSRSGVVMLDGDRAKVLLFVDQTSTRTDENKTSAGGSQLSVNAELRDGKWKITQIDTYNDMPQPPPAEQPAPPNGN
ncbi:Mce-associated membrane protein [Amycolatopsis arida]|uniref:Mce-associated membrane protein n=1 Tax=Amycolatopsis arida TaxID=587909 RepID=A0A1I6A428_9PSEU|nr:hypothetical protein [Amycolatopsis arida]TDX88632.1 Mce-associated membrane protein [Amycolatopsis arida]SFQ63400.1 Mce-associated membrane protein [Amycolatopsis arida]